MDSKPNPLAITAGDQTRVAVERPAPRLNRAQLRRATVSNAARRVLREVLAKRALVET